MNADSNGILHDMISKTTLEIQGVVTTPWYLWYMGYNLGMVWGTIMKYTSKCA